VTDDVAPEGPMRGSLGDELDAIRWTHQWVLLGGSEFSYSTGR
jgi:hypothetical protein